MDDVPEIIATDAETEAITLRQIRAEYARTAVFNMLITGPPAHLEFPKRQED